MRAELAVLAGQRLRFRARVERFGRKNAYRGIDPVTVLLNDVVCVGLRAKPVPVTDHLWLVERPTVAALRLLPGDILEFDARVTQYTKGYRGRRDEDDLPPIEKDWRLSFPTAMRRIASGNPGTPNPVVSELFPAED